MISSNNILYLKIVMKYRDRDVRSNTVLDLTLVCGPFKLKPISGGQVVRY